MQTGYLHIVLFPLQVTGVGKTLKMPIGQREALSQLDIAQLRDMYRCNQLQDTNKTGKLLFYNVMTIKN